MSKEVKHIAIIEDKAEEVTKEQLKAGLFKDADYLFEGKIDHVNEAPVMGKFYYYNYIPIKISSKEITSSIIENNGMRIVGRFESSYAGGFNDKMGFVILDNLNNQKNFSVIGSLIQAVKKFEEISAFKTFTEYEQHLEIKSLKEELEKERKKNKTKLN